MKIKRLAEGICFCCTASVALMGDVRDTHPLQISIAPTIFNAASYIPPYFQQAVFRATQPSPRRNFIESDEDTPEEMQTAVGLIDKVIVIPVSMRS